MLLTVILTSSILQSLPSGCGRQRPKATCFSCPPAVQAGGVGDSEKRVNLTKFAGGWGFMVAAVAFYDGTASLMKDVYGRQILPVFPLKPVNKVSLGDFGTKRFVDTEAGVKA